MAGLLNSLFGRFLQGALLAATLPAWSAGDLDPHRIYGKWHSSVFGSGGRLLKMVFTPSDPKIAYVIGDVGGVWRSDDGGQKWHMIHGALPSRGGAHSMFDLAVDPLDANKIMLMNFWGIWASNDGGKTFTSSLAGNYTGCWAGSGQVLFDPKTPDMVYACLPKDGFYKKSSKNDYFWTHGGIDDVWPVCFLVDARNSRRMWLGSRPPSANQTIGGAQHPLKAGLFMTEDGGSSWTQMSDKSPQRLVQAPKSPATLIGLFGDATQVMASTDDGRSWQPFNSGLAPYQKGMSSDGKYLAIAPNGDTLLLGGCGGNFYRHDGKDGIAWGKVFARDRDRDRIDDGADWWPLALKRSKKVWGDMFGACLTSLTVSPHDPNHWAFTDWYGLYQSHDGGKSWKLTIDGIEMLCMQCVMPDVSDPQIIHAGAEDIGYIRSTNGGLSFTRTEFIGPCVKSLAQCASNPNRLYAAGPRNNDRRCNQVFVSDDKGLTWRRAKMKNISDWEAFHCDTIVVAPNNADVLYTAASGGKLGKNEAGVWKSMDAGETWTWMGEGLSPFSRFDAPGNGTRPNIAASGDGSLLVVDNGGSIFRREPKSNQWVSVPLKGEMDVESSALAPLKGLEPIKGVPGLVNAIVADPKTPGRYWLAKTQEGLWRSDDGGKTWLRVSNHEAWTVAVDCTMPQRILLGDGSNFHVSLDAGDTWRKLDRSMPDRDFWHVSGFGWGRVFVGTHGNGIFWTDPAEATSPPIPHGAKLTRPAIEK